MFHTPSRPISTGRLRSSGAVRKCSSISWPPASISSNWSMPSDSAIERPTVDHSEYRPPTQSHMVKRDSGAMPNASIALWLVETATKWCAIALLAQFADQPLARRVGVGERLLRREGLGADDEQRRRGLIFSSASASSTPSTFDTQCSRMPCCGTGQRLRRHHDAEIRAADADVDDVGEARAGEAEDAPLVHAGDELAHLGKLRRALPASRPARPPASDGPNGCAAPCAWRRGPRCCSRARRRTTQRCAPAGRRPGPATAAGPAFRRDALPGEVVEQVERLHAGRIEAAGAVGGEQVTQVAARELRGVRLQRLPGGKVGAGCGHPHSLAAWHPLRQKPTASCGASGRSGTFPRARVCLSELGERSRSGRLTISACLPSASRGTDPERSPAHDAQPRLTTFDGGGAPSL